MRVLTQTCNVFSFTLRPLTAENLNTHDALFGACFTGTMTGGGRVLKGRMGSSIGTELSQVEVSGGGGAPIWAVVYQIGVNKLFQLTQISMLDISD